MVRPEIEWEPAHPESCKISCTLSVKTHIGEVRGGEEGFWPLLLHKAPPDRALPSKRFGGS